MAFCSNCGSKMEPDERFCVNCGTPAFIPQEAQADPPTQQLQYNPQVNAIKQSSKLGQYMKEILEVLIGVFVKPITTVSNLNEKLSSQATFIFGGLITLLYGILATLGISVIVTKTMGLLGGLLGEVGSLNTFGLSPKKLGPVLLYFEIFIFSIFIFILFEAILFACLYLAGKYIFRSETTPLGVLKIVIVSTIPLLATILIGIVFAFISVQMAMIILFAGIGISIFVLYGGINNELKISEDKLIYVVSISYLVTMLIVGGLASSIFYNIIIGFISSSLKVIY